MNLVKVYEHKKVDINNEEKHLLKIAYVTYAEISGKLAILKEPKNKRVKKLSKSLEDIENEDYIYDIVDISSLNLSQTLNELEVLENVKTLLIGEHYEIEHDNDIIISFKNIKDNKIIDVYKYSAVPSLAKEISSLINNIDESGSLVINAGLASQILYKTNSLELQDVNAHKGLKDYDINGIYYQLKEIIFGQDKQLKIFLANIVKNVSLSYLDIDRDIIKRLKNNILLIGPTGTGKTLMAESLANILEVPYIICDAKRYTSNGYSGEDTDSILLDLYRKCNEDMKKFEHGIIFIDEFDKLCEIKDDKSHVNTTDVQENILKLLDGTSVNKTIRRDFSEEHLSFDTSKITFVLSGAFTKMFENESEVSDHTLEKYGMISELVGRIGSMIILNRPTREDLRTALLEGKYSYLQLFNYYLKMLNIDYEMDDNFIEYIVDLAFEKNLGYRGLEKAISAYVDEYLFDLISGDSDKLVYQTRKRIK